MNNVLLRISGMAFLVIAVAVTFNYLFNEHILFFEKGTDSETLPTVEIAFSVASMFLGIVFGGLYNQIENRTRVNIWTEIKRLFQSATFARALLVSPIVFCGVYIASRSQPDRVVAVFFAFQNGFFCHQMFLKRKSDVRTEDTI